MANKVDGPAIAAIGVGVVFLWGGIKGYSPLRAFQNLITGQNPNTGQTTSLLTNPNASASNATVTSGGVNLSNPASNDAATNQTLAKQLAISMGHGDWTSGQMWSDWVSLWNQESGWKIDAANPTSRARGIAQDINGYGPDNLQGNAISQITWGINYISGRYGNPSAAEAHERANNWY